MGSRASALLQKYIGYFSGYRHGGSLANVDSALESIANSSEIVAEQLSKAGKDSDESYCKIGLNLFEAGELPSAELCAVRSILMNPANRKAYELLGLVCRETDRVEESKVCFGFKMPESLIEQYFVCKNYSVAGLGQSTSDGHEKTVVHSPVSRIVKQPGSLKELKGNKFNIRKITSEEAYLARIQAGRIWYDGHNIVVWDKQGNLVEELCLGNKELVHACAQELKPEKIDGPVCLLGNRGSVNYYHWLNDALPRIEVLRQAGGSTDEVKRFVSKPLKAAFQKDSIARLGISADKLAADGDRFYLQGTEILVPVFGCNRLGRNQDSWIPEFLSREFGPECRDNRDRRIYISRGSTGSRGVLNEDEVTDFLEKHGFEILKSEEYSMSEQAEIFASASVVVGPHGAGFTNIAHCRQGTKVIEFFADHFEPCFWLTSEFIGLDHYAHYCEPDSCADNSDVNARNDLVRKRLAAIRINLDELKAMLELADVLH